MQLFEYVQLTSDQILFLKNTDFDLNEIPDSGEVAPEVFIREAGLVGFEMGKLEINDHGEIEKKDQKSDISTEDIALISSYIKQQVRDRYGIQLKLKPELV